MNKVTVALTESDWIKAAAILLRAREKAMADQIVVQVGEQVQPKLKSSSRPKKPRGSV